MYIYLDDIPDWDVTMTEAISRLPDGYEFVSAGAQGAWAEPRPTPEDEDE